ncbi:UNKNOWN [Stylonychia lemnae]|uniref:Uncharacterized protein n=1 Tax=Stylonychia lemnae TaxID=5949 RepID=A0A078AET9_STYLE|nr:UNKNOWN [Stylonychia lemnae]|eukprot:CDW80022.1 UNKNOWN [Stylonychia lemnae]
MGSNSSKQTETLQQPTRSQSNQNYISSQKEKPRFTNLTNGHSLNSRRQQEEQKFVKQTNLYQYQDNNEHNYRGISQNNRLSIGLEYTSTFISEDEHKVPINQANYVTKNTLSKRQQNPIPQLTQRVMQKKDVILYKTPLNLQQNHYQNQSTSTNYNHFSSRIDIQSNSNNTTQNFPALSNLSISQSMPQFQEGATPQERNHHLQMSILSTGESRQYKESGRIDEQNEYLSQLNPISDQSMTLLNVKLEFEKELKRLNDVSRQTKSSSNLLSYTKARQYNENTALKKPNKMLIKSSIAHSQKMNLFQSERGSVNTTIQEIKNKRSSNHILSSSSLNNHGQRKANKSPSSNSGLNSARQSNAINNRRESYDTQLKNFVNSYNKNDGTLNQITQGLQSLIQYTERQKQQLIPPWKVQDQEDYYKQMVSKNKQQIKKSASQISVNDRNHLIMNSFNQPLLKRSLQMQENLSSNNKSATIKQNQSSSQLQHIQKELIDSKYQILNPKKNNIEQQNFMQIIDEKGLKLNFGLNQSQSTFDLESSIMRRKKGEQKEFGLSNEIVMLILQFNMNEYIKYIRISAGWYYSITQSLDQYSFAIEGSFINEYQRHLNFLKSYTSVTPINFCNQKGIRLDRIFQCEISQQSALINQTYRIQNSFEYLQINKKKQMRKPSQIPSGRFHSEFRFDIVKKGSQRITWVHKSEDLPSYSQNELQVSPGDIIEFAVCLYNMNGIINIDSFQWEQPQLLLIPQNEKNPLVYNKDVKALQYKDKRKSKLYANTNRICELEDAVVEWIPISKSQKPKLDIEYQELQTFFNIISIHFNEVDQHFNRIVAQAKRRGIISNKILGESVQVMIKPHEKSINNEIKKRGVMFDRNKVEKIELRIGDILIIYTSKRIPRELQPRIIFDQFTEYNSKVSQDDNYQEDTEISNKDEDEVDDHSSHQK